MLKNVSFRVLLGVAGVHPSENRLARQIGHQFEWVVLAALFGVFVQLLMSYSGQPSDSEWLTNLIWAVFALELVVNLVFVKNRVRYLRQNWMNVLIVCLAFPWIEWGADWALIVRSLRLILFIRFFTSFFKDVIEVLNKNKFGQILLAFAFIIVGSGALFAYIEDRLFIEGIWYAIVTITTVGYGDVVPQTTEGRYFGAVLILFGVVFFSLVSANIAAFLIGSEQRKLEKDILRFVKDTEQRLAKQSDDNEKQVALILQHFSTEIESLKQVVLEESRKSKDGS